MSTVTHLHDGRQPVRGLVAGEVRAQLARARLSPTEIARRTGRSQTYWWRRITSEEKALDVEDLAALADALGVSIAAFFPDNEKDPRPGVSQDRGHSSRPRRGSNPQPTGQTFAQVTDLNAYRATRFVA